MEIEVEEKKEIKPIVISDENVFRSEIRLQPDGSGIIVKRKVKKSKYLPHQGSRECARRRKQNERE